jgi:serine/threonine protein kinase/tetratricopeptide (TPR) repeat protein
MDEASIFLEALKKSAPNERAAFLDQACGGNEALRHSVELLLKAHDKAGGFLAPPSSPDGATVNQPGSETAGMVIGPYKLIEPIGEGGMGTVWMAQQTEPVKRLVAVKLIKAGMDSKQVIARFEAERQALALMDHPNIARVLDGGTTSAGRPYFVMDLVKGVPITRYCDEHRLTPRQRLELFLPVCQAVQHAHQKGIIHRDLKPSNVLVAQYDGRPVPKVIDFGVAKAAGQSLTDKTLVTGFGNIVGTLEYMSPEQAEVNQLDIDTRSDIYSLGVLLYELLAGSPPFTQKELEKAGMLEMLRVIREQEPSKPSTKLSTAEGLPTLAANRGTEPAKLTKLVRGELDWIVMKALEKDRNRRYETANGFAMDVQRYLADEAVQACPPSAAYRLHKFARRNKVALAVATVLVLAMFIAIAAVAGSVGWASRDRAARQAAVEQEANLALKEAERWQEQRNWPEALSAAKRAEGLLAGSGSDVLRERVRQVRKDVEMVLRIEEIPLLKSEMKENAFDYEAVDQAYANAFTDYGIDIAGLSAEEAAARIRARANVASVLVAAIEDWADARYQHDRAGGRALFAVAVAAEQDPWRRQVREAVKRKDTHALVALAASPELLRQPPTSVVALARAMSAIDLEPAKIEMLRRAQRQYPGDFWINEDLARALVVRGAPNWDEVVSFRRAALAVRPQSAALHSNLGNALKSVGKIEEAVAAYQKAIELDPACAIHRTGLSACFREQRKLADAVDACRKAIDLNPKYSKAYDGLGIAFFEQGKVQDAIAAYRKAIELDPKNARAHFNLAGALRSQNKRGDAIASLRRAIEANPRFALAYHNLGLDLKKQGNIDEALTNFRKATELDPKNAKPHDGVGTILCDVKHDYEGAIVEFRKAIDLDPKFASPHYNLGCALEGQKKRDEALVNYRKAIELDPKSAVYRKGLVTALGRTGWYLVNPTDPKPRAFALAKEALELDSKSVSAWRYLGWIQYRTGSWMDSIESLEKSCKLEGGGDAAQWIVLALAHAKLAAQDGLPENEREHHKAEARRRYEEADKDIDKTFPSGPNYEHGQNIWDFRLEARKLMGVKEK